MKAELWEPTVAVATHQTHPSWLAVERHQDGKVATSKSVKAMGVPRFGPYTMLLARVQMLPTKVLMATVLSLLFPFVCCMFLNE